MSSHWWVLLHVNWLSGRRVVPSCSPSWLTGSAFSLISQISTSSSLQPPSLYHLHYFYRTHFLGPRHSAHLLHTSAGRWSRYWDDQQERRVSGYLQECHPDTCSPAPIKTVSPKWIVILIRLWEAELNRIVVLCSSPSEILPGISAQTQTKLPDISHLTLSFSADGPDLGLETGERKYLHNNLLDQGPVMAGVRISFVRWSWWYFNGGTEVQWCRPGL